MPVDFYHYRFVLTGGGTGGHIMPLLAIAEVLKDYPADIMYVGEKDGREEYLAKENGIVFRGILAGKLRRYFTAASLMQNIYDLAKMAIGFFHVLGILVKFRPHIIVSKGGYVSLPVVAAGWVLRIPIIIHESDMSMGLANRIASKMATCVATGFPVQDADNSNKRKMVYTGIPLQKAFFDSSSRVEDYEFFNFEKRLPVLLITGGIQGGYGINQAIKEILPTLIEKWQVVHLVGEKCYPEFSQIKETLGENAKRYAPFPVLGNERVAAMRIAEVVVSRASATTLAEISLMGKPSIIIPLPTSAGGHQLKNAQVYSKAGAAILIEENNLTGKSLYETIEGLRKSAEKRKTMSKATSALVRPEASRALVEEAFRIIRQ